MAEGISESDIVSCFNQAVFFTSNAAILALAKSDDSLSVSTVNGTFGQDHLKSHRGRGQGFYDCPVEFDHCTVLDASCSLATSSSATSCSKFTLAAHERPLQK